MHYRNEIDGLRAVAIISVILFHAGFTFFRGGFIGVDIFFVISGFLMTTIILNEKEAGTFTLRKFYERRVRRILPMLIFTLMISFFPAYYYLQEKELIFFTKSVIRSVFAISNIFFANNTGGYFDTATNLIPLIHTWTLGVEEQFYIILPLIFIFLWKIGKNKLFVLISYLVIISFFLNFVFINKIHNFYLLHTRFWELGVGSLIAVLPKNNVKVIYANVISALSLIAVLLSVYFLHEKISNLQFRMLIPVIGTAFLIIFAKGTIVARILSIKPLSFIGLISYSAYLIHQPLFAFLRIQSLGLVTQFQFGIASALTFVLAYFTWRFVENPFRKSVNGKRKIGIKVIIISSIAFICLFIIANIVTKKQHGFPKRLEMSEELRRSFEWAMAEYSGNPCIHADLQSNMKFATCQIGDFNAKPTYFLTGDSTSLALVPLFRTFNRNGVFADYHYGGIVLLDPIESKKERDSLEYRENEAVFVRENIMNFIKKNDIKDIYISSLLTWTGFDSRKEDIKRVLIFTLNEFQKEGRHLYWIQTPPTHTLSIYDTYINLIKHNRLSNLNIREYSAKWQDYEESYRFFDNLFQEYDAHPNFTYIKIDDIVCDKEVCPFGTTKESYYADVTHLSVVGVKRLDKRIRPYVENKNNLF